jgi:adenine phosphoribosyltransferase
MHDHLKQYIRDVPDFPKPGIVFKDITPLLAAPGPFQEVIDVFARRFSESKVDKVIGIESRGFIFGSALAYRLDAGFVPVRKRGKLPWKTMEVEYSLEYGTDCVQMHEDALKKDECVLVVDDLLATGGTAAATIELVKRFGVRVRACLFAVELDFLEGRQKLQGQEVISLLHY